MIKNYIKIAWRNIVKSKVYSALNIVGLSVGMAVALMIGLWVFNEYSYDNFLPDADRLYQVKVNFTSKHAGKHTQNAVSLPLSDVMKDYPDFEYVAESGWDESHGLVVGDKKLFMKGPAVGVNFFKMFQFPFIKGNPASALKDPYSIVLTESTAKALFAKGDAVGKVIKIDNQHNVKVTGVLKDLPANSSFQLGFILPFSFYDQTQEWVKRARTNWGNNSFQIYAMLKPGVTYAQIAPKIKGIIARDGEVMRASQPEVIMQPLKDWHLYTDFQNGIPVGGFIDYVRMFSIIGALVLLIACINFMNLSTARSEKRAREVGVRKAMGSLKRDLIFQFLTESVLMVFLSFILALVISQLSLPYFNSLTGGQISIPYNNVLFWLVMFSYILVTGLLAGSRPAFYLSSFNPVKVLKGSIQVGRAATLPRKILVVGQFSCSIALIICTVVVYQQIQHVKDRPIGYNINSVVMSDMSDDLNENYDALKNDLMQSGIPDNVARATSPLTEVYNHTTVRDWPQKSATDESINIATVRVSDNYFKTVGMQILKGHDFSSSWQQDTNSVLLNEAAVQRMGLKEPVGQKISWNGGPDNDVEIIGVVKNALMESPFTPVEPALFSHGRRGNFVIYHLPQNADIHTSIKKIEAIFNKHNPAYPFTYRFVDEAYNQKFNLETLVGKLAGIFAGLAIFISCLGLFGLAAYVAEQRTKEIGIRKVLGASVGRVCMLLSSDFIWLVVISCLIASPIAYYFLHSWLAKYDYRITITPGVFILSGLAAIIITLLTISFQAIKAAIANPVKSLRSE
jgi:putative ABC transport system permease protein